MMEESIKQLMSLTGKYATLKELYGVMVAKTECLRRYWESEQYLSHEEIEKIMGFKENEEESEE